MAPSGQTLARMNSLGYSWNSANWGPGSGMPPGGILTVTVPGSVWGWDAVLGRFGSMTFKETLQPVIDYAEQGFPISERIAEDWRLPRGLPPVPGNPGKCCTQMDPDSIATWYIGGKPPAPGQIYRNPDLAKTFRILQQKGRDGFYKGEVARAIVAKSNALGGTMTLDDLAAYAGEWVTPATTNYHGYDVATLPPPAQTWATDEMLNILESCVPVWAPGQTLAPSVRPIPGTGTSSSRRKSWPTRTSIPTTPIRTSCRCLSIGSCRSRTRSRCVASSSRTVRRRRHLEVTPMAPATRSCSRPRIGGATWCPGSTATTRVSVQA